MINKSGVMNLTVRLAGCERCLSGFGFDRLRSARVFCELVSARSCWEAFATQIAPIFSSLLPVDRNRPASSENKKHARTRQVTTVLTGLKLDVSSDFFIKAKL